MGFANRKTEKIGNQIVKIENLWELVLDENKHADLCPVKFCNQPSPRSYGVSSKTGGICSGCKMRLWRKNNPISNAYSRLRQAAKRRGKDFNLTLSEFEDWCFRVNYLQKQEQSPHRVYIRRINLNLGFQEGNLKLVVPTPKGRQAVGRGLGR